MKSILLLATILLTGCRESPQTTHTVVLLDTSASIDKESFDQAIHVIGRIAARMRRGDRLSVIPITGRTQNDVQGRVIRFELPIRRQAYDRDLTQAQLVLTDQLDTLRLQTVKNPSSGTDILGAITVSDQERQLSGNSLKVLMILSDFIQDDSSYNFMNDTRLLTTESAKKLAGDVIRERGFTAGWGSVALGYVHSRQMSRMSAGRTRSIQAFWKALLGKQGRRIDWYSDCVAIIATN